ncbi:MAG: metallophosphoesterase [Nanoarchaeota archaeon]|nr:metallophosphoesterase [Nanoarchaeota archaeon]
MKFAILNDIHYGEERIDNGIVRKFSKQADILVSNFIEDMNSNIKPEFVLILGDLIESKNHDTDLKSLMYLKSKLEENLNSNLFYCIGNHEQRALKREEVNTILNLKNQYYSFQRGEIYFIVLYSIEVNSKNIDDCYNYIDDEQVRWLREELINTSKKVIIFVHHCLADQKLKGNPYFNNQESNCLIKNRVEIREIINKADNVICVFNSHIHWNKLDVHDNIPHITLQSLVENEENKGIPAGAYTIVGVENNEINVDIKGNYPLKYKFKF